MSEQVYLKQGEAFRWLIDNGFELARSTFNNHWNGVTKLKQPLRIDYAKKVVHIDSLKVYAAGLSKMEINRESMEAERADLDLRKLKAEVNAAEGKAERERRANLRESGSIIDRAEAEMAMARKLVLVYDRLRAQIRRDQDHIVRTLDLPTRKSSLLIAEYIGCLDRAFNAMRDRKEFDVLIEGDHAES